MSLFRRRGSSVPQDWEQLVRRHVAGWRLLEEVERDAFAEDLATYLRRWRFEAARGFEVDDRVRVTIAAQAALLTLGLGSEVLVGVRTVIVHPSTISQFCVRSGPVAGTEVEGTEHLLGEANHDGPILLAWDAVKAAARHPSRGQDVVFHELAHKLDMLDHIVDGTPPMDPELRSAWIRVCTQEFEALQAADDEGRDTVLDPYGATDPGEFFAVATETFLTVPDELEPAHPELYDLLRRYYRQDPGARLRRAPHTH